MPKLDLKRLAKDVDVLRKSRPADLGPGGRRLTGAMAIVRDNLEALEALHASGTTWVDIAAGLAAQGVTQGNGDPITGNRLTALRASVKRQAAKRAERQARRSVRPDLRRERPSARPEVTPRLTLSKDLAPSRPADDEASSETSEEAIRRENLAKLHDLLKSPPKKQ